MTFKTCIKSPFLFEETAAKKIMTFWFLYKIQPLPNKTDMSLDHNHVKNIFLKLNSKLLFHEITSQG